jgi:S-adenosyl methyltransferase
VLLLGILLFIPDEDDPFSITARLMAAAAPGSYLAISHGASDIQAEAAAKAGSRYNERSAVPLRLRTHAEVSRFFDGLEILEPGIVPLNQWQPGQLGPGAPLTAYAGLGRKPA